MIERIKQSEMSRTQVSKRQVLTTALLLATSLIATMGTIGCAVTGRPSVSSSNSSNAHSTASPATAPAHSSTDSSATNGSTANNSPATATNSGSTVSNGSTTSPTAAAAMLSASSSSLSFGNVQVGSSTSQLITLTNNSDSNLIITAVSTSGTGFSTTGGSNITMTAYQSVSLYVNFTPTAAGSVSGTVLIASNAMNSMLSITVSGTGAQPNPAAHTVALSWTPSSSNVVGYYVERSNTAGGPYTRVSTSASPNASYNDNVTSGTYYYVVTALDSNNAESGYSNEVQAIVP